MNSTSWVSYSRVTQAHFSGMDCVAHSDILPFTAVEREPLDHDLFHRIFDVTEAEDGIDPLALPPSLFGSHSHALTSCQCEVV